MSILLTLLLANGLDGVTVSVFDSRDDTLTGESLIQELSSFDVVFVGEEHDSRSAHDAELAILRGLYLKDSSLVMALEMFERDVEGLLDSYLGGEITEDTFLALSRPWPNYQTDYRALVEFAKEHRVPVIAANVPRRAAAAVAKANQIAADILGADSVWLPARVYLDSEEYYQRFAATMEGMSHAGPMGGMNPDALFKAQVLKDAVMAASLEPWLKRKIVFFCGRFHSDYHLGIPYQLSKNHPELKIAVVTLMPSGEALTPEERRRIADYLWVYP